MARETRQILLKKGMQMLLRQGYADLGVAAVLEATDLPKGSFYHHFKSKEDFALAAIDLYMVEVHDALNACMGDESRSPLDRVRFFFENAEQRYKSEGYLGCLLGGLGQELSGISEAFRAKVEQCFSEIARQLERGLKAAVKAGDLKPDTDTKQLADLLVNCWEGAALRSRLKRNPAPLRDMLDFYFQIASS